MPEPRKPESEPDDEHLPFAERWVAPFVREPLLWPVAAVIVAHGMVFLAPVLLLGLRDRRYNALGALVGITFLTGAAVRAELARLHRPGVVCGLLATTWSGAVLTALAAHRLGIF